MDIVGTNWILGCRGCGLFLRLADAFGESHCLESAYSVIFDSSIGYTRLYVLIVSIRYICFAKVSQKE
jgi:hypothetical protein